MAKLELEIRRNLSPDKKLKFEVLPGEPLEVRCEGNQPIKFEVSDIDWGGESFEEKITAGITTDALGNSVFRDRKLPNLALSLHHRILGGALQGLFDGRKLRRAAEEIVDRKCQDLGCNHGENCAITKAKKERKKS